MQATLAATILCPNQSHAFAPHVSGIFPNYSTALHMTADFPDIASMRILELKKELETYGISTKSFLEKGELVDALGKARAEGKTPVSNTGTSSSSSTSSAANPTPSPASAPSAPSNSSSEPREDRIAAEMEKCRQMKASELKSELESYGIPTKSFFEKSEFVKACAEARVDGTSKSESGADDGGEGYAEYANVEVLTSDDAGPRKKSEPEPQSGGGGGGGNPFGGGGGGNPFGGAAAGGNPFGGAAGGNPFGGGGGGGSAPGGMAGMGGMGGIADMLKNMGGMGGGGGGGGAGGGNPFGGGMPGGADAMKKAQELMGNPKVREIMTKAQSNPKVMAAVTECMSNPAAFAKYQNDPEIGALIRELQEIM